MINDSLSHSHIKVITSETDPSKRIVFSNDPTDTNTLNVSQIEQQPSSGNKRQSFGEMYASFPAQRAKAVHLTPCATTLFVVNDTSADMYDPRVPSQILATLSVHPRTRTSPMTNGRPVENTILSSALSPSGRILVFTTSSNEINVWIRNTQHVYLFGGRCEVPHAFTPSSDFIVGRYPWIDTTAPNHNSAAGDRLARSQLVDIEKESHRVVFCGGDESRLVVSACDRMFLVDTSFGVVIREIRFEPRKQRKQGKGNNILRLPWTIRGVNNNNNNNNNNNLSADDHHKQRLPFNLIAKQFGSTRLVFFNLDDGNNNNSYIAEPKRVIDLQQQPVINANDTEIHDFSITPDCNYLCIAATTREPLGARRGIKSSDVFLIDLRTEQIVCGYSTSPRNRGAGNLASCFAFSSPEHALIMLGEDGHDFMRDNDYRQLLMWNCTNPRGEARVEAVRLRKVASTPIPGQFVSIDYASASSEGICAAAHENGVVLCATFGNFKRVGRVSTVNLGKRIQAGWCTSVSKKSERDNDDGVVVKMWTGEEFELQL